MESDASESNILILTNRDRFKIFTKAYISFYVFLVTSVYWITDVLHPSVIALIPIAMSSLLSSIGYGFISEIYIRNELLDCVGVMMLIIAIEYSQIHRRVALKLLLIFGCSHYRLSFLLFFISMFLSMWITNVVACGLMMPIVKAILVELEKMGISEIYQVIGKARSQSRRHEQNVPRPTDFTVFYFLGVAYSSSIGGMATIMGSQTNQIFKLYCEQIFPASPKIEFPHFLLLNLPGVLVMETLLYLWMNFYFLRMFRSRNGTGLEISLTEEEALFVNALLTAQYKQLGRIRFQEIVIGVLSLLTGLLQATVGVTYIESKEHSLLHRVSSPCYLCVVLLFMLPVNLDFISFFRRSNNETRRKHLPIGPTKACLNWPLINNNLHWNVLFIIGGSGTLFESLKDSKMTEELDKFLLLFQGWSAPAVVLVVILYSKILTEFASNSCVAYCLLPGMARLSVVCHMNPHCLMMASALACALPFHLVTGSPVNAIVCAYMHIPHWKMMRAGIGPSIISILVVWFTITVWSTAAWTDINLDPAWATYNMFNINIHRLT
ncbi:protein I'm not dead yet isoform X2 [Manduca sexta]|uniref:protein I'm not dead yet isoform X2 n=1 Tax=Manduca sexta TaxID=7130 RepID=UPI00188F505E|nr:protein I'm not dead yet isoform X2 [Manduca sexta]